MTSVSLIPATIARIQRVLDEDPKSNPPPSWRKTAVDLHDGLETVSQKLKEVRDNEINPSNSFIQLEKHILDLSYEIDDFIIAAASAPNIPSNTKGIIATAKERSVRKIAGMLQAATERSSKTTASSIPDTTERSSKMTANSLPDATEASSKTTASSLPDTTEASNKKMASMSPGPSETSGKIEAGTTESSKKDPQGQNLLIKLKERTKELESEIQASDKNKLNKDPIESSYSTVHHKDSETPPAAPTREHLESMEDQVRSAVLEKNKLPVVSIWGKAGMGKSILAKNVYHHSKVRETFRGFAWAPITGEFQTKKILQNILLQLLPDRKADVRGMDEIELAQQVFTVQMEKRCLLVLEDVEALTDWQGIRIAFPIGLSQSKILIITCYEEVAVGAAGSEAGVYPMRSLTEPECMKILKKEADFNDKDWNDIGRVIYHLSGGSPLTTIVLGKSLKRVDETARLELLNPFGYCLPKSQESDKELPILKLSYRCLPNEKKPCFLYMGQFPENHIIQVENLYLLLAAENLVQSIESMKNGLKTLSTFGLVEVKEDKVSNTYMYKSCRLHKKIRNLCISQGMDENFFEIVEFESEKILGDFTYRLALNLSKCNGQSIPFKSLDTMKRIRSLLVFDSSESQQKSMWPREMNDLKDFSYVRILHFDGVDFKVGKFPKGIEKLVLLRYLSFRGCPMDSFPNFISKFPCLETLDLRVIKCKMMIIPDVFFNMKKLRHLYFPEQYQSENGNKLNLLVLELLEVLVNFDTEACDVNHLSKLENVRILTAVSDGNHRDLDPIINYLDKNPPNLQQSSLKIRNFDNYTKERTTIIKKLLECKSLHSLHVDGIIDQIPENIVISETIVELVFDGLELEENPMDVLGKAKNLRSLALVNNAFVGDEMNIHAESKFPNLRILKLESLQYTNKLTFERGAVPMLSTLVIKNCEDLKEVLMPKELKHMLEKAQEGEGDDEFLVEPLPALI